MKRPTAILAATPKGARQVRDLVGDMVELVHVQSLEEAAARLREASFDLAIIGYHVEEMHPYRFVLEIRQQANGATLPIIVVTALRVDLGRTSVDDVRCAYRSLGADTVLNLYEEEQAGGQLAAGALLRKAVTSHLKA